MARIIQAGEFATQGEQEAAEILKALPDDWIVICNKMLVVDNGRSFEIDFIVLGHNLIFVLDEKSWRGSIHGSDQVWVRGDGSSERSPLSKIEYVCKVLAGYLRSRVAGLRSVSDHFLRGGVLLSQATQRPSIRDPRAADGILLPDSVVRQLQTLDCRAGTHGLVATWKDSIQHELVDLSNRPKTPQRAFSYSVQDRGVLAIGGRKPGK